MRPGYRQFCAAARTLDLVGQRWTLLVVRELALRGPLTAAAMARGLPDVPMNQLSERLALLEARGLVREAAAGADASDAAASPRARVYELTDRGRELEDLLGSLARFGLSHLADDPAGADDAVLPHVLMRQLELRYELAGGGLAGRFELHITDPDTLWSVEPGPAPSRFALAARPDGLTARAGACLDPDATLSLSVAGCAALVAGRRPADVEVAGDAARASALLDVLAPSAVAAAA
jgi:DNA-binding HxlR family transcriptional regulator